jgi:AcrR family transcriptional regulator
MAEAVVVPRRDRLRLATITEIKATARRHLAVSGAAALSLRAVARELGMTASALYRYFASRDDLLTALMEDGFRSLGDALQAAYDSAPAGDHERRWLGVARAHRDWALRQPELYALCYGAPVPGFTPPEERRKPELMRAVGVMFQVYADALADGAVDLAAVDATLPEDLRGQLAAWEADGSAPVPAPGLAACMLAWTTLHGLIALEVFGHFPPPLADAGPLFDYELRGVLTRMGLRSPGPAVGPH